MSPRPVARLPLVAVALAAALLAARGRAQEPAPPPELRTILGLDAAGWQNILETHEGAEARRRALFCLGEFGPAAAPAIPSVQKALHDIFSEEVRWRAAEALGLIGPAARTALPELLTLLASGAEPLAFRRAACEAVARIAPEAPEVAEAVFRCVKTDDTALRHAALEAAVTVGQAGRVADAREILARRLREDEDAEVAAVGLRCLDERDAAPFAEALRKANGARARRVALDVLARLELNPEAWEAVLRTARKDDDPALRAAALRILAGKRPGDEGFLEAAAEGLGVEGLSPAVEELLAKAGPAGLETLRAGLRARRSAVRAAAARAAGRSGAALQAELVQALGDRETEVRLAAAQALGGLGPAAAEAKPPLEALAREAGDARLRRAAVLAAANVGRAQGAPAFRSAFEVLPLPEVLEALARDSDPDARAQAASALRRKAPEPAPVVQALTAALSDKEPKVRLAAAASLALHGARAKPAVPALLEHLKAKDAAAVCAALGALAGIGPAAPEALGPLVDVAATPWVEDEPKVRALLGLALRAQGEEAAARLAVNLKAPEEAVRRRAALVFRELGPTALDQLPALLEAAEEKSDTVNLLALEAIACFGPDARRALPKLVWLLQSPVAAQRVGAATALLDMKLAPEEADQKELVEALILALLDPHDDVARAAYKTLTGLGPAILPRVRELLKLAEGDTPFWVLRVLTTLKSDPQEVIPRLMRQTLFGMRSLERGVAAEHLADWGPEHPESIPVLVRMLGSRDDYVGGAGGRALARFGAAAVPALKAVLHARDPRARRKALAVLDAVAGQ